MMDKDEPFVYNEVDYKTPKQSPQTWPKRNYNISNAKSLLLQCLRDAKSDPLPRRRFPVSCSDEGILMDGVLVTSATKKKVSESPSSSLGGSARSSIFRSQHKKNTEFSSPINETGRNQETTRSQQFSSAGEGKILSNSPYTPKAAKLKASAEPFILTPRQAIPFPLQQHPYNPRFPCSPYLYLHPPRPLLYLYQKPPILPLLPHGSDPYMPNYDEEFPPVAFGGQRQTRKDRRRNSLPTTPSSSQPNTTTSDPPVRTPLSTTPTANFSTSTATNGHGSSPSVDGLNIVTQIPDLSPPASDGLETVTEKPDLLSPSDEVETVMTQKPDLASPSDEVETVTTQKPDLSKPSDEVETVTQKPDLSPPFDGLETDLSSPSVGLLEKVAQNPDLPSPSAGRQTMTIEKDWSPSDDGLPTFTQAQLDFMESHNRVLPDYVFGGYKYKKRMSVFKNLE